MAIQRGEFGSKIGFILAAAGSAVGLGNIWKFPFEVGKGGGAAFVIVYLLFCFILCLPVMVTEIAIGRKTNRNPVGAFIGLGFQKWKFIGYLGAGFYELNRFHRFRWCKRRHRTRLKNSDANAFRYHHFFGDLFLHAAERHRRYRVLSVAGLHQT